MFDLLRVDLYIVQKPSTLLCIIISCTFHNIFSRFIVSYISTTIAYSYNFFIYQLDLCFHIKIVDHPFISGLVLFPSIFTSSKHNPKNPQLYYHHFTILLPPSLIISSYTLSSYHFLHYLFFKTLLLKI